MGVHLTTVNGFIRKVLLRLDARTVAHAVHLAYAQGIFVVPQPEPRALVSSGPTHEAMHRMLAAGWPLLWQAREAGINPGGVNELLLRTEVLSTTEERVLAAAERLLRLDPVEYGINPRVVSRARNEARRRGWARPTDNAA
jgi:hypothetical protein